MPTGRRVAVDADLTDLEMIDKKPIEMTIAPSAPSEPAAEQTYKVRKGDGFERIARRHGMGPEGAVAVAAANGLSVSSTIHPGQELLIPASYDKVVAGKI